MNFSMVPSVECPFWGVVLWPLAGLEVMEVQAVSK